MDLCDALRQLVDDETLTVKQIATAVERSPSTVCRWLSVEETAEPSAGDANQLICELADPRARDLLAQAMLDGTMYRPSRPPEKLDINDDGTIDLFDVAEDLHNAIELWEAKSRALTAIRREGSISDQMHDEMQRLGNQLIHEIERAMATITEIHRNQPKRRKAAR